MPNWKLEGSAVVWDEDAPDPEVIEVDVPTGPFDPSAHTIEEVKEYVGQNPDDVQRIYDAEVAGKGRTTLLDWLTSG